MDPVLAQRFNGWLAPRETIRWIGRPIQGFTLQRGDLFMIPFSLVWLGFVVFWLAGTSWPNSSPFFTAFGIFFLIIGLNQAIGRYFTDAYIRTKTVYALTDSRALVLTGWKGDVFIAVDLRGDRELHFQPDSGSRGTLTFGPQNYVGLVWSRRQSEKPTSPEFVKIENAKEVYAMVQRLRSESRQA